MKKQVILLVEDNPADIKITERALRDNPLAVQLVIARDGQEAIDYLLKKGPFVGQADWVFPDLVLLDLNLPKVPGQEVLKFIRATPQLRFLPVVVLTTSSRVEEMREAYAAGANTYIEKPSDFHHFVEVLSIMQRYWLSAALLPPSL